MAASTTRSARSRSNSFSFGATPFKAPSGYLNERGFIDGREYRTVVLDPDRARLVAWAFEAYSTGDYSELSLLRELAARGLNNKASGDKPERPMHLSKLHRLLTNSYYTGIVTYRGVQYDGKHPAPVTAEVFDEVQRIRFCPLTTCPASA